MLAKISIAAMILPHLIGASFIGQARCFIAGKTQLLPVRGRMRRKQRARVCVPPPNPGLSTIPNQTGPDAMTDTTNTPRPLSRRALIVAGGTLAALPAAAVASTAPAANSTPIAAFWADAERLRLALTAHSDAIAAATDADGIAGWMRLGGEANRLGNERHGKLVAILKETPRSPADLAIMAQVTLDDDVRRGGFNWAGEQFARAVVGFSGAVAA
jgi:hypothetical protein